MTKTSTNVNDYHHPPPGTALYSSLNRAERLAGRKRSFNANVVGPNPIGPVARVANSSLLELGPKSKYGVECSRGKTHGPETHQAGPDRKRESEQAGKLNDKKIFSVAAPNPL